MCSYILECIHAHKCNKCQILRRKPTSKLSPVLIRGQWRFPLPPLEGALTMQRSYKPQATSRHLVHSVLLHIKIPLHTFLYTVYLIHKSIKRIHTKIFGIRQDKLWSIALYYISANAVAYIYIYILEYILSEKETENRKRRPTTIGYRERASGYVLMPTQHHSTIFKGHITFTLVFAGV